MASLRSLGVGMVGLGGIGKSNESTNDSWLELSTC